MKIEEKRKRASDVLARSCLRLQLQGDYSVNEVTGSCVNEGEGRRCAAAIVIDGPMLTRAAVGSVASKTDDDNDRIRWEEMLRTSGLDPSQMVINVLSAAQIVHDRAVSNKLEFTHMLEVIDELRQAITLGLLDDLLVADPRRQTSILYALAPWLPLSLQVP
jgi:hypothetical protein